jgi:hypothetical protein
MSAAAVHPVSSRWKQVESEPSAPLEKSKSFGEQNGQGVPKHGGWSRLWHPGRSIQVANQPREESIGRPFLPVGHRPTAKTLLLFRAADTKDPTGRTCALIRRLVHPLQKRVAGSRPFLPGQTWNPLA